MSKLMTLVKFTDGICISPFSEGIGRGNVGVGHQERPTKPGPFLHQGQTRLALPTPSLGNRRVLSSIVSPSRIFRATPKQASGDPFFEVSITGSNLPSILLTSIGQEAWNLVQKIIINLLFSKKNR